MKTILVDAVNTLVLKGEGVYQPLFQLLENYPNKKIILSNANDDEIMTFGLADLPYELFTLKHQPDKTDPAYFRQMLAHFGCTPDSVVYFEHNEDAVNSARSVGIKSHHYDKDRKDLHILKAFLDKSLC